MISLPIRNLGARNPIARRSKTAPASTRQVPSPLSAGPAAVTVRCMNAQAIRQDRILDEAHAGNGNVRRICDLFGLSVVGAYRYAATVDHPGVRRQQIHER
ncbi:hypothetical protein SAMN04489733_2816 [Amycolatopsis keratiniphila]|nr:hypothetical protein SAMN04489733_2816 [Amycolatopsis keratiniphila]